MRDRRSPLPVDAEGASFESSVHRVREPDPLLTNFIASLLGNQQRVRLRSIITAHRSIVMHIYIMCTENKRESIIAPNIVHMGTGSTRGACPRYIAAANHDGYTLDFELGVSFNYSHALV